MTVLVLILFFAFPFLVYRDVKTMIEIARSISYVHTPGRLIACSEISKPWHSEKRYPTPRYVAAVKIEDEKGRLFVIDRLTPAARKTRSGELVHASAKYWVKQHNVGDTVNVYHPPGRIEDGFIVAPSDLWFQFLWRLAFSLIALGALVLTAWIIL